MIGSASVHVIEKKEEKIIQTADPAFYWFVVDLLVIILKAF